MPRDSGGGIFLDDLDVELLKELAENFAELDCRDQLNGKDCGDFVPRFMENYCLPCLAQYWLNRQEDEGD